MQKEPILELCDAVRETSLALHAYLRNGHLERVYQNGLANRLSRIGLKVEQHVPLVVADESGEVLGEFFADLLVESSLIVEIKACRALAPEHTAQLLGYLRACRLEHGLIINFGAQRLEIRKFVLSQGGMPPV